jgi:hypothetical protein
VVGAVRVKENVLVGRKISRRPVDVVDAGKLMLTLFWDMNGQILERYQEKGETVNSMRYSWKRN